MNITRILVLALCATALVTLSSCASTAKKCCGTDGKCCHACNGSHDH